MDNKKTTINSHTKSISNSKDEETGNGKIAYSAIKIENVIPEQATKIYFGISDTK